MLRSIFKCNDNKNDYDNDYELCLYTRLKLFFKMKIFKVSILLIYNLINICVFMNYYYI